MRYSHYFAFVEIEVQIPFISTYSDSWSGYISSIAVNDKSDHAVQLLSISFTKNAQCQDIYCSYSRREEQFALELC